jgi:GNAT superfamily N-acetyltransferase
VTIRKAVEADIPTLVELGRRLHDESPHFVRYEYSSEKVAALARRLIVGESLLSPPPGGVLVAELEGRIVGMIVGLVIEHFFGSSRFATDLTFYVAPEHRGGSTAVRLIRAFEEWARENGAQYFVPGTSTEIQPERTLELYKHLGYRLSGYVMTKEA